MAPIMVRDEGGQFEQPPTGMQPAVCCSAIDLGIQEGFQGKPTHKAVLVFELAERRTEGAFKDTRFTISKTYTASLNEMSNLSKDLEAWRGRPFTPEERQGFDLEKLIGVNATLNLVEKANQAGRKFVMIASINPKLKAVEEMKPEQPGFRPKWVQDLLAKLPAAEGESSGDMDDSSIPF